MPNICFIVEKQKVQCRLVKKNRDSGASRSEKSVSLPRVHEDINQTGKHYVNVLYVQRTTIFTTETRHSGLKYLNNNVFDRQIMFFVFIQVKYLDN